MTEDYFIKQLNETFDELNNALIKSFINIFGEKNKYKIINRINNLNLVLFAPNLSLSVIEESLNYYDAVIAVLMVSIAVIEMIHIPSGHLLNMAGKFKISVKTSANNGKQIPNPCTSAVPCVKPL